MENFYLNYLLKKIKINKKYLIWKQHVKVDIYKELKLLMMMNYKLIKNDLQVLVVIILLKISKNHKIEKTFLYHVLVDEILQILKKILVLDIHYIHRF